MHLQAILFFLIAISSTHQFQPASSFVAAEHHHEDFPAFAQVATLAIQSHQAVFFAFNQTQESSILQALSAASHNPLSSFAFSFQTKCSFQFFSSRDLAPSKSSLFHGPLSFALF